MGKTVLVVDSDESNFGLHRQLGVELPRDYTEYFGGKDKAFKKMMAGEILDTVKLSAFANNFFRKLLPYRKSLKNMWRKRMVSC